MAPPVEDPKANFAMKGFTSSATDPVNVRPATAGKPTQSNAVLHRERGILTVGCSRRCRWGVNRPNLGVCDDIVGMKPEPTRAAAHENNNQRQMYRSNNDAKWEAGAVHIYTRSCAADEVPRMRRIVQQTDELLSDGTQTVRSALPFQVVATDVRELRYTKSHPRDSITAEEHPCNTGARRVAASRKDPSYPKTRRRMYAHSHMHCFTRTNGMDVQPRWLCNEYLFIGATRKQSPALAFTANLLCPAVHSHHSVRCSLVRFQLAAAHCAAA